MQQRVRHTGKQTGMTGVVALAAFVAALAPICKEPSCWENKVIYQILTDRFAIGSGAESACADLTNYCGGTWRGIYDNLDYIVGLGVDAIWISPILANTPGGCARTTAIQLCFRAAVLP